MGSRGAVPAAVHHHGTTTTTTNTNHQQQFNLRSANSFIGSSSLHDLNALQDRDDVTADALEHHHVNDASNPVDCIHDYRSSLQLHHSGPEDDHSNLHDNGSPPGVYDLLTAEDISPIETARARFLQIVVDHFIAEHVIEVTDQEADFAAQSDQDKLGKRKSREVRYEGDPNFALPLMYVANLYETLVSEVNMRLASLNGTREKTIGMALEAAGGLYRRLAKKFPKQGSCTFRRRELATSSETRMKFPGLVVQEEKRVRFVVVNGLVIVEKPNNVSVDDAEWFKRLTGRDDVAISTQDYKFYSPRHKFRRASLNSIANTPSLPTFPGGDSPVMNTSQGFRSPQKQQQASVKHHMQQLSQQSQFQSVLQNHQQPLHQSQSPVLYPHNHQCGPSPQLPEIAQSHPSATVSQQIACLHPFAGHAGGRLHQMPAANLAKYCDECGAMYLRETSKFCSECGVKRLGT